MNLRFQASTLATYSILASLLSGPAYAGEKNDADGGSNERLEQEMKERGEARDHALRRAEAFEDMYRDEFGRIDPDQKLRAAWLNQLEAREQKIHPQAINGSVWNNLGPTNFAGRVSAVAVDPANSSIIYRGTAGGGVWKSTDGGTTWTVLTDSLGDLSIGAVAIAPSNSSIIYVGTGEGALGSDAIGGIGFIKSTDAGATWGLPVSVSATRFFDLSVHPTNANEIVAATQAGIQKSTDGGATWATKFSTYIGTALARVPGTPATIIATVWDVASATPTWTGRAYRSTDSGETWSLIVAPGTAPFNADNGRMSIAISPAAPATIYLLSAAASGDSKACPTDKVDQYGFYRSTDGGTTWAFRNNPVTGTCGNFTSILAGQGWYANTIRADVANASILYAGGLDIWKSTDGAATWSHRSSWFASVTASNYVHADIHAMSWAGGTLLIGNDGGINKTTDGATSFSNLNTGVVTRQYYALAVTPANRNLVIGGAQDNGTNMRTTNTTTYSEVIGGDGFGVAAHQTNASILYGTVYNSRIFRSQDGGATFPEITPSFGAGEKLPFISPLTMDPNNSSILYTGSQFLYKTINGGTSWTKTSTTDLGDGSTRGYLTKIAVAKSNSSFLLTSTGGTGFVKRSTDGGTTWSAQFAGLPAKYAANVEFDPLTTSTFYVAFAGGTTGGRLFKTTNSGTSFTQIDAGLPNFPVHVVRVDPTDVNTLYAGSDLGLYRSTDGGTSWARFGTGIPAVSIWDIAILPDGSLMRVGTHGRGFWELTIIPSTNTAPTASITAPTANVTITAGGSVSFSGSASDPDAGDTLTYAWAFGDGATSTVLSPGAHTYTTAGTYTATFKATDNHGASSATQSRTITVNPVASTFPESAHPYANSIDLSWTYTLAGAPSSINVTFDSQTSVESTFDFIYVMDKNGVNITGSPFTGTTLASAVKNVPGDTVKIRLTSDASVTQYGFKITNVTAGAGADTTPPSVSISSPASGATITGATTVSATASDNVGVSKVEFYLDGVLQTTDTTSPYSWAWSPTSAQNGAHSLTAKAYDAANNSTTSAAVSVTVSISTTCTPAQVVGNSGFESGAVTWTTTAGVIDNSTTKPAHAGSWKAWMNGYGSAHTDTVTQNVTIPACATTATLTFWMRIDTAESATAAFDTLTVAIKNSAGTSTLQTLATYSNLNSGASYVQKSFDVTSFKGQTIQISFTGVEDASAATSFLIDDVLLNSN